MNASIHCIGNAPIMLPVTSSFVATSVPAEPTFRRVSKGSSEALQKVAEQVYFIAEGLIRSASVEEYRKSMVAVLPEFAKLVFGMSSIAGSLLTETESARLAEDNLETVAKFFRKHGDSYLGTQSNLDVDFSIRTLQRSIRRIPTIMSKAPTTPERKQRDAEISAQFAAWMMFSQLNLECLRIAMVKQETVNPGVLEELLDGVGCAVEAYACVREALDLRGILGDRYEGLGEVTWDAEDQELVND